MAHPEHIDVEALQQTAPAAVEVLAVCAFLAPDDIPLDLLRGGQQHLPQPLVATVTAPSALAAALAALLRYAQVERVNDALCVPHGLHALVSERLDTAERAVWAAVAVMLVHDALPADSTVVESWPIYARLLPHALAATCHAEAYSVAAEATARVLNGTGVYLYRRGQFQEACGVLERAVTRYASVVGEMHPATAGSLNNLAVLYTSQGRYEDAESLLQQAITISEGRLGRAHPETAVCLNNLGALYNAQSRYRKAAPLLRRALTILRSTRGDSHPHTQDAQRNLAALQQHLRDDTNAGV